MGARDNVSRMKSCAPLALVVALSSVVSTGCAKEAPDGLDDLATFLWARFEPAGGLEQGTQETEIRDAVQKLRDQFEQIPVTPEAPFTGTLKDIDEAAVADLENVGDRAADIALAQGFVLANFTSCSIAQQVGLVASNRAMEIHPDVYESYDKDFDDDTAAFKSGDLDFMTWRTTYTLLPPPVGSAYTAKLRGAGRRIEAGDDVGEIFLTRVHLLEPATFDGEGSTFDLDFQMELYVDNGDDTLSHFYTMWRHMVLGPVDSSSEAFIGPTLSGFVDFEDRVEAACQDGTL
jgi:hypothetical protein